RAAPAAGDDGGARQLGELSAPAGAVSGPRPVRPDARAVRGDPPLPGRKWAGGPAADHPVPGGAWAADAAAALPLGLHREPPAAVLRFSPAGEDGGRLVRLASLLSRRGGGDGAGGRPPGGRAHGSAGDVPPAAGSQAQRAEA